MPLDQPIFPNELEVPLNASTAILTSSGCLNPGKAVDDDPTTYAEFIKEPFTYPSIIPSVTTNNIVYFNNGQNLLPGDYMIYYIGGVVDYNTVQFPNSWSVNTTSQGPYRVTNGSTYDVVFPASGPGFYNTELEAQTSAQGSFLQINGWPGGPLGVYQSDINPSDNIPGPTLGAPTFSLVLQRVSLRYLRVDWGYDALISRVRFKQDIPSGGLSVTGIDFESSLGYLEGDRPPPDLEFAVYVPLPVGGGVHELTIDPPIFSRGIVVFPDSYAPAGYTYPEVDLYQLQVYQLVEGENVMSQTGPNPTTQWATVGVQVLSIYPWVQGSSYLTLPAASLCSLYGLQTFGLSEASKAAIVTGGETVFDIEGFETSREVKIKITNQLADMRYYYLAFNGTLVVDPADSFGPEVQYWVQQLSDRTSYVTIVAEGTNGDPNKWLIFPKCKIDGNWNFSMERDKVTDIDIEYRAFIDKTWIRMDGNTGAAMEFMFSSASNAALHS